MKMKNMIITRLLLILPKKDLFIPNIFKYINNNELVKSNSN